MAYIDDEEKKRQEYIAFMNAQKGGNNGSVVQNVAPVQPVESSSKAQWTPEEQALNSQIGTTSKLIQNDAAKQIVPGWGLKQPAANNTPWQAPAPVDRTALDQSLSNYLKGVADFSEPPLSKEEREKRERAATAVGGIGALGNVASAFSNLIWTGKGAPSQTLPKAADANASIKELRDDERVKYKNYIEGTGRILAAQKADYEMRNAARQQEISNHYAEQDREIKAQQLQMAMQEHALKMQLALANNDKAAYQAEKAKWDAAKAQYDATVLTPKRATLVDAQIATQGTAQERNRAAAENSRQNSGYTVLNSDGSTTFVPKSAWNDFNAGAVLGAAGMSTQSTTTQHDPITGDKTSTRPMNSAEMRAAAGNATRTGNADQAARIDQAVGNLAGKSNKKSAKKTSDSKTTSKKTTSSSNSSVSTDAPYLRKKK